MTLRLCVPTAAPAEEGAEIELPPGAARHAQVRRVQPGDAIVVFDGRGAERAAHVLAVGRSSVRVRLGAALAPRAAELAQRVTLAFAVPANERIDALVEKATELGASTLQPLISERSVLRLSGERADRRRDHWQAVATAACEQCGRAQVPAVEPVQGLAEWLALQRAAPATASGGATTPLRLVLSLQPDALPVKARAEACAAAATVVALSGPEGGLTPAEEEAARRCGFLPTALGGSVLRADTAPLALMAWLALEGASARP